MKHKILIFAFLCAAFSLIAMGVLAASYDYTPMEKIPGTTESISAFPDYIKAIYKFAIWAVGIAALFMISVGGFMYFTAAGNTSKLDKAKIVIRDSIFGITAILTAYLLLYTINPDLVGVSLSGLSNLNPNSNTNVSFQPASPSQGTVNSNFTTHINITGNGTYTLESLTITGIDTSNYTSSSSNNTITVTVPNPQLGTYQITAVIQDQDDNSYTSENLNFKIISDFSQLAIANLGLNEGTVNKDYSQTIQAGGGNHNYTISVSGLPNGLTFNSTSNTIIGTPTQAGTYPITITVNDGTDTIEKEFSLNVREGTINPSQDPCSNEECSNGQTQCTAGGWIQHCGDYDDDSCLEFGPGEPCPEGGSCSDGSCGGGGFPDESCITILPLTNHCPSGVCAQYTYSYRNSPSVTYGGGLTLQPGELRYYKFWGAVSPGSQTASIDNQPASSAMGGSGYSNVVVKAGSPPTMSDYNYLKSLTPSQIPHLFYTDFNNWYWWPGDRPPEQENLFWCFNMTTGPSTTWIQGPIFGGWNHEGWIYFMLYNDNSEASVSDKIDLIVALQGLPGPLGAPTNPSYIQGVCGH